MKKTALMLLAITVLLTGTIHPDHVQAGTVTVVNKTPDWYCNADFTTYFWNNPSNNSTPCAAPGKTEWRNTWLSTGYITCVCTYQQSCKHATDYAQGVYNQFSKFTVPGTWLPHRNFTCTVTSNPNPKLGWCPVITFEEK